MSVEPSSISQEDQEQIRQTIEMFEVITQANPHDCQSLEILKDAYQRIGQLGEMLRVGRQLAGTYVQLGQYSSAMLEYEGILQRTPDDTDILAALAEVEEHLVKSGQKIAGTGGVDELAEPERSSMYSSINLDFRAAITDPANLTTTGSTVRLDGGGVRGAALGPDLQSKLQDDGNEALAKFLVQHRLVAEEIVSSALERVQKKNRDLKAGAIGASLIDEICRRGAIEVENLLSGILERSKFAYIPLEYYDVDRSIVKMLPENLTMSRLIVPFDIMSRTVMIATANPFDALGKDAVQQLLDYHVQWHVAAPQAIVKVIGETYRLS
jgi:tetratricopeptide (TPR) repeat protein